MPTNKLDLLIQSLKAFTFSVSKTQTKCVPVEHQWNCVHYQAGLMVGDDQSGFSEITCANTEAES